MILCHKIVPTVCLYPAYRDLLRNKILLIFLRKLDKYWWQKVPFLPEIMLKIQNIEK